MDLLEQMRAKVSACRTRSPLAYASLPSSQLHTSILLVETLIILCILDDHAINVLSCIMVFALSVVLVWASLLNNATCGRHTKDGALKSKQCGDQDQSTARCPASCTGPPDPVQHVSQIDLEPRNANGIFSPEQNRASAHCTRSVSWPVTHTREEVSPTSDTTAVPPDGLYVLQMESSSAPEFDGARDSLRLPSERQRPSRWRSITRTLTRTSLPDAHESSSIPRGKGNKWRRVKMALASKQTRLSTLVDPVKKLSDSGNPFKGGRSDKLASALSKFRRSHKSDACDAEDSLDGVSIAPCRICLEHCQEDDTVRIAQCAHRFCRTCLHRYLSTRIDDHRFPIVCPVCAIENNDVESGTMITGEIARSLSLSTEERERFDILELESHSTVVRCPSCLESSRIDKETYQRSNTISCPAASCSHSWCKSCTQRVDPGVPHICQETRDMEALRRDNGWTFCPGCSTLVEKISGCNHMACPSPGCNTHFCYGCGELIVRSLNSRHIQTATSLHYTACNLYEH